MGNLSARTKKECKEKTSVRILGGEGRQRCAGTMAFNKFPDYSSQVWIPFRSVLSMLKAGSGEHKKQPPLPWPRTHPLSTKLAAQPIEARHLMSPRQQPPRLQGLPRRLKNVLPCHPVAVLGALEKLQPFCVGYAHDTWRHFCLATAPFGLVAYVRLAQPKRVDRRLAWALRAIFAPRKLQLLQGVLGLGFGSQHAIKNLNLALG